MKQGFYELSTTPKYPIGMRIADDDRVFRYCYAIENLDKLCGAFMNKLQFYQGDSSIAEHAVGVTTINFDNTLAILAHELKNGWWASGTPGHCQRIKDNLAGDPGGPTVITLKSGQSVLIPANSRGYAYPNLYANVINRGGADINSNLGTVVCVPLIDITAARYFWGLTWGIFYGMCGSWGGGPAGDEIGCVENHRSFAFDYNGAMVCRKDGYLTAGDGRFQQGGYIMMDGHGATGGDQLCMLQLSP